jgi:hypothetical protein
MPSCTSDIGSGLVSHAVKSSKLSNDKTFDSLFYESYEATSIQSAKVSDKIHLVNEVDPIDKQKDVTIDQLETWKTPADLAQTDPNPKLSGVRASDLQSDMAQMCLLEFDISLPPEPQTLQTSR